MELSRLIAALSDGSAFLLPGEPVAVRQTHISVVFLVGPWVYKIKKPVSLGFLDFSTLARRHHFCAQEVQLNRRLAPSVYRGVVPITSAGEVVRVGGDGTLVEWAVQMTRLPDDATLKEAVVRGTAGSDQIEGIARRIARFHAQAERGEPIAAFGRFDVMAGNARDNFEQSAALVGTTVSPAVFARTRQLTEEALERLRPLIERRAARGMPCDTHGDLHLDHVYCFDDRPPPDDLIVIDCIEFNNRFR